MIERDFGQEIDDLSSLVAALLTGLRDIGSSPYLHSVSSSEVATVVALVDAAHADLPTDEAVAEVREAALSLAQAEAYYRAMAEQAKREAGFGSRAVVGDETAMLGRPTHSRLILTVAQANAYLAIQRAVRANRTTSVELLDLIEAIRAES